MEELIVGIVLGEYMARMISMIVVIGTLLRVMISGRVGPCMLYIAPKDLVNNSHKLWGPYTLYLLFRSFVRIRTVRIYFASQGGMRIGQYLGIRV